MSTAEVRPDIFEEEATKLSDNFEKFANEALGVDFLQVSLILLFSRHVMVMLFFVRVVLVKLYKHNIN